MKYIASIIAGISLFFQYQLIKANNLDKSNFPYHFEYLTSNDGLPQNLINAIVSDNLGYMWFATGNGLCRYNGRDWTIYTSKLPSGYINSLLISDNKVWIGTRKGLCYFDLLSEEIVLYPLKGLEKRSINIMSLLEDNNGDIWVGTEKDGLFRIDVKDNKIVDFTTDNSGLRGERIRCLIPLSDYELLAGTDNGIFLINLLDYNIRPYLTGHIVPGSEVYSMLLNEDKHLWVGTFDGLIQYQFETGKSRLYNAEPRKKGELTHGTITALLKDSEGKIYVGTLDGTFIYQPETDNFFHIPLTGPDHFRLNNRFIKCLYQDIDGNIWIGTDTGGVNYFSPMRQSFYYLSNSSQSDIKLNARVVNSVYRDDNYLFIGTAGGGVNIFNVKTGEITYETNHPEDPGSIGNNYISAITKIDDNMWFGTWGEGVCLREKEGKYKRFTPSALFGVSNLKDNISSLFYQKETGILWIGTEGGLVLMDVKRQKFIPISRETNALSTIQEIGCLLIDKYKRLWVGTRNGLFMVPVKDLDIRSGETVYPEQIRFFSSDVVGNDNTFLPGNFVTSLCEDSHGALWAGTFGKGVSKVILNNLGDVTFTNYSTDDGLSNGVIYSIVEDDNGALWFSTDEGLSSLLPKKNIIQQYTVNDGLLSNQFYWGAGFKDQQGVLYFGSVAGLNYFLPQELRNKEFSPNVCLTGVKIYNRSIVPGEKRHDEVVLNRSANRVDTIRLSYKEKIVSFNYTAVNYDVPEKIKYAYKLSEVDPDWVETPRDLCFASYSNLKGGEYIFSVKAWLADAPEKEVVKNIVVIVKPAFWQTTWFKALLIIVLLAVMIVYSRYYSRRLIRQKRKLEKLVQERTQQIENQKEQLEQKAEEVLTINKDLEEKNEEILSQRDSLVRLNRKVKMINQMKLQFFTNVSHEFRTPLTLIISPLEKLIKDKSLPKEAHSNLEVVYKNARRLNALVDNLLTFRKLDTGKMTVQLDKGELSVFINDLYKAFEVLANERMMKYTLDNSIPKGERLFDHGKLENIIYNLVSNAFKYTPQKGSVHFSAKIGQGKDCDHLLLEVSDNGVGIRSKNLKHIFDRFYRGRELAKSEPKGSGIGLSLTKDLVNLLGGVIKVQSEENRGTVFTVSIPLKEDSLQQENAVRSQVIDFDDLQDRVAVLGDALSSKEDEIIDEDKDTSLETVLIVEDNIELRNFIASTLKADYNVLLASDGKEGFDIAKRDLPQLIISDVMMPNVDGFELCKMLKGNLYTSHIPIVLLTAKALDENMIKGLQIGADDYILKPFSMDVLSARINNIIYNRAALRKLYSSTETEDKAEVTQGISDLDKDFLERAEDIMNTNYTSPEFSVENFSRKMLVSRSLLYKKLKSLTGLSPNEYVTVYRLRKSLDLLKDSKLNISDVAYQVGFNDPKYYSRVFKKMFKVTPTEYNTRN